MTHEFHDFGGVNSKRTCGMLRYCAACGADGDGAATDGLLRCPGNSNSHQDPEDSTLWDRLTADLETLGAAYGPITEGVGEAVIVTPGMWVHHSQERIEWSAVDPTSWTPTVIITEEEAREKYPDAPTPVDNLSPTDRNAYFDGIILAARKKREKEYGTLIYDPMSDNGHEWSWNTEACAHCGLTSTDILEHGDVKCDGGKARNGRLTLSAAMSSPLTFSPRVGWKGHPLDE